MLLKKTFLGNVSDLPNLSNSLELLKHIVIKCKSVNTISGKNNSSKSIFYMSYLLIH